MAGNGAGIMTLAYITLGMCFAACAYLLVLAYREMTTIKVPSPFRHKPIQPPKSLFSFLARRYAERARIERERGDYFESSAHMLESIAKRYETLSK